MQRCGHKSGQAPYDMLFRLPLLPSGPDGVHPNGHYIGPGRPQMTMLKTDSAIQKEKKSRRPFSQSTRAASGKG